jgi:ABC-type cobalamin/Fe3+-siderophores transport system ATPase subunit
MSELLQLAEVNKSYRRGSLDLHVLRGASLQLGRGEIIAVLGTRGEGKTTLLQIAAGMESPDSGAVCFDGEDLATRSDAELSRLLGRHIAWAGRTGPEGTPTRMLDYVEMPLLARQAARLPWSGSPRPGLRRRASASVGARARAALERVGAAGCAEQLWDTLSDWERALVEIAQAIAGEPSLLLVDDLTDQLGIRETHELTALLRSLSRELDMGVLMGVSDAHATLLSDQILTLAGGRLTPGPQPANVYEFPDPASARRDVRGGAGS